MFEKKLPSPLTRNERPMSKKQSPVQRNDGLKQLTLVELIQKRSSRLNQETVNGRTVKNESTLIREEIDLKKFTACTQESPILIDSSDDDESVVALVDDVHSFKEESKVKQVDKSTSVSKPIAPKTLKTTRTLRTPSTPKKPNALKTPKTPKVPKETKKRTRKIVAPPDFKVLTFDEHQQVAVDGFQYTCPSIEFHFLSHFHGDHYGGISKSWFLYHPIAKIYCSEVTRDLMIYKFNIHEIELQERIVSMPLNQYTQLNERLKVYCIDANHCPGALLLQFEYERENQETLKYLHTGDFRFNLQSMQELLHIKYHKVYLDTTYLNYRYKFPNKLQLVEHLNNFITEKIMTKFNTKNTQKQKTLEYFFFKKSESLSNQNMLKICVLIGAYNIGKEDLIIGLCKKFNNCKLIIDDNTLRSNVDLKYENCVRTNNFSETILQEFQTTYDNNIVVCIVPTSDLSRNTPRDLKLKYCQKINQHFSNFQVVSIIPTGWSFTSRWSNGDDDDAEKLAPYDSENCKQVLDTYMENGNNFDMYSMVNTSNQKLVKFDEKNNVTTIKVPYSDHSSFTNLCEFGVHVNWQEMIPTVNMHKGTAYFDYWFQLWKLNNIAKSG